MRGGCPWVVCIGGDYMGDYSGTAGRTYAAGTGPNQNQQPSQNTGGVKCPDKICDDYEKMNPWACPEDCGGTRQPGTYNQQQPGTYQPPQNTIDQPQQPNQNQNNFCSGQAPSCDSNNAYCQNGNWICPPSPQEQQTQQPQQQQENQQPQVEQQPSQEPQESPQQPEEPASPESGGTSEEETPSEPITGSVISGRVITSVYGNENARDGDAFLDYWFMR